MATWVLRTIPLRYRIKMHYYLIGNFFWKIHYFRDETFVEFEIGLTLNSCIFKKQLLRAYSMGALDAPVQGSSFLMKIKLAFKVM